MISNCPHCEKALNLSASHKSKIEAAVLKNPGKPVKFGCPSCKKPIEITAKDIEQTGKNQKPAGAQKNEGQKKANADLKPDAINNPDTGENSDESKNNQVPPKKEPDSTRKSKAPEVPKPINPPPPPPEPPDISWLKSGKLDEKQVIEDVPTAIIMMPEGKHREAVAQTMQNLNYQLYYPENTAEVIGKMRFKDFAAAVYHTSFEGNSLRESEFHRHISNLPMVKRRYMFYILIGTEFKTLYDLEALAYSANIFINEA